MIKKHLILVVTLSSSLALASDKDESVKKWKSVDALISDSIGKNKKEELQLPSYDEKFGFGGNSYVCYDLNGDEFSKESCDTAKTFAMTIHKRKLESVKTRWKNDKCSTQLDDGFCLNDYKKLKKLNLQTQDLLNESKDIAAKTIPNTFGKYQALVDENLKELSSIEIALSNPEEKKKQIKQKLASKECKVFQVTADICRKSYIEAAADKGLSVEDQATKHSGVTNLYSRYKLGQMKAIHGTGNLQELKKQYKSLVGSDWSPKMCESSSESSRKYASGELSIEDEEVEVCGCSGLDCQDIK